MQVYVDLASHVQYIVGGASPHILEVGATPGLLGDLIDDGVTIAAAGRQVTVTFSAAHGLTSGDAIVLSGLSTTPDINGQVFPVRVTSTTTVTIPVNVTVTNPAIVGEAHHPILTPINGRYVIPIIEGTDLQVTSDSYVFGPVAPVIDGGDISSQNFAGLLARYPLYSHIHFNPLLLGSDLAQLDLTATFRDNAYAPPEFHPTRAQTGTSGTATAPNSTAILPNNAYADTVAHPGVLITTELDISPWTPAGTDEFMIYWKIHQMHSSPDVAGTSVGITRQINSPAIRSIVEIDQEPSWFDVYVSVDNGLNWQRVDRLVPVTFGMNYTLIRVAFLNRGPSKVYLTNYAIMW